MIEEAKSEVLLEGTRVLDENLDIKGKKIILNRGGTRSSKSYSLVELAIIWLFSAEDLIEEGYDFPSEGVWSICRKTLPSLKATGYRDFKEIMDKCELWDFCDKNLTELTFTVGNRMIEFFSLDDQQKVRSRKRAILHVIEANEMSKDIFIQLNIRTKHKVFLDWNPDDPHIWIRESLEIKRAQELDDVKLVISTYKDNPYLSDEERREIEYLEKEDPELWAVFGTGEYGTLTGLIFKDYEVKEYPHDEVEQQYLGLDFGWHPNPTAVILVGKNKQDIYLKELVYGHFINNQALVESIKAQTSVRIGVADVNEPKSRNEINAAGFDFAKAEKGPDSVRAGIMQMRGFNLHVDPGSINLLKEFRTYKWRDEKAGEVVKAWDHGLDASRYVISKMFKAGQGFSVVGSANNYRQGIW